MKACALLTVFLAALFSLRAETNAMERISPHLAASTPILWQAGMTNVPKRLWVYRRMFPFVFSESVISNAIVLASLQSKGFPKPSRDSYFIPQDMPANWCCPVPVVFEISPSNSTLSYGNPDKPHSTEGIPDDSTVVMRAWKAAFQLGIVPDQVLMKNFTTDFNMDKDGNRLTSQICGRGVFLSRELDGLLFWGTGDDGPNEGFWMEFGSQGKIRGFSLNWPQLERFQQQPTATPQEIIACVRAHKVILLPGPDEEHYFERLHMLEGAKSFAITKITPYYGEGILGEVTTNDTPSVFISPVAELEAVADWGTSHTKCRLYAPILSADVRRLLK